MKAIYLMLPLLFSLSAFAQKANETAYQALLKHFHSYVDSGTLAGTVIFTEKQGVLQKDAYGFQNISKKIPMSENSLFRLASMTKPITATAIMMLVEDGKLKLDDEVSAYIPQVANMRVYDGSEEGRKPQQAMTIAHLLSHTSGSTSSFDMSEAGQAAGKVFQESEVNNLQELVEVICQTQLAFDPGKGWAYGFSNDLLAYIIEKVSGMPVEQFFKTHIFEPLEMKHTSFNTSNIDMLTGAYMLKGGKLEEIGSVETSKYANGQNMARGNGGLVGSAADYLNFCRMILNKGAFNGKQLLKPSSVEAMTKNAVGKKNLPLKIGPMELVGHGYGYGFGVMGKNSPFGTKDDVYWPGALYTCFFISPKNQSIGIFMTQLHDRQKRHIIWEFIDLASKALE